MVSLQEYGMNFNPWMKVNFEGSDLTSDAGLLLYKEFDHKLDLSQTIKQLLVVNDPVHRRNHPNSDVALQTIYQHLCSYAPMIMQMTLSHQPLLTA